MPIHDPHNANKGTREGRALLRQSMQRAGAGRSVLMDKNDILIAGNKAYDAFSEQHSPDDIIIVETTGDKLVIVKRTDLDIMSNDDLRARELAYYDNRTSEVSLSWDIAQLIEDDQRIDLGQFFDQDFLDKLRSETDPDADAPSRYDQAGEFQSKYGTTEGQLWKVGNGSYVYIGDSLDPHSYSLMSNQAQLLVTSPPYWIGKDYETEKSLEEIVEFIERFVSASTPNVRLDGRIVINTGTAALHRIEKRPVELALLLDIYQHFLKEQDFLLRHIRIWTKASDFGARISGKSDMVAANWEHVAEFTTDESSDLPDLDWAYLGVFYQPSTFYRGQNKIGTPWAQQAVWNIPGQRSANGAHVAAFPVELPERFIRLYTHVGELVLEPFCGSGSTIIAAERNNRFCYAIERDPAIAAVGLARLEEAGFTLSLSSPEE